MVAWVARPSTQCEHNSWRPGRLDLRPSVKIIPGSAQLLRMQAPCLSQKIEHFEKEFNKNILFFHELEIPKNEIRMHTFVWLRYITLVDFGC